jgi:excisionase family DNA binding protein
VDVVCIIDSIGMIKFGNNDSLVKDSVSIKDYIKRITTEIDNREEKGVVEIQGVSISRSVGKDVLTADETSYYLGISKQYLYKLVQLKLIPYHKPGGKMLLFLRSELVAWVSTDGNYKGIPI